MPGIWLLLPGIAVFQNAENPVCRKYAILQNGIMPGKSHFAKRENLCMPDKMDFSEQGKSGIYAGIFAF